VNTPRLALIVVDMLIDFFERQPRLAAQRGPLSAAIDHLARAFRAAGQPVIWIRQEFKPDLSDAFLEMRRHGIQVTIAGTDGCEILPELERRSDERVIVKKRYSAFFGTALDELLRELEPHALVLAGINTHACIRTTAIDAYQRDYDVIVASDSVGSHDDEHHRMTLQYLDGRIARLMSNEQVIALLRRDAPSSSAREPTARN
jgi:nicotinamidase-related amidase